MVSSRVTSSSKVHWQLRFLGSSSVGAALLNISTTISSFVQIAKEVRAVFVEMGALASVNQSLQIALESNKLSQIDNSSIV
jgi:hypothetical protein